MAADHDITNFIRDSFGSVWTLELALKLASDPGRTWTPQEMVAALRASDLVVGRARLELEAAGLIVIEREDAFRYAPASDAIDVMMSAVGEAYARAPDKLRRIIVDARTGNLAAFADAFRIRKDSV